MKILFIGDIVGEPGRAAVAGLCRLLCERHGVDYVIANGENAAGGSGITLATARELLAAGVDVITNGDHVWDQKEFVADIVKEPRALRPANYPAGAPGQGWIVWSRPGLPPIAVINLLGRTYMPPLDNPFALADTLVEQLRKQTPVIIVDMHGEATSEKIAMGRFLDGRVSAVIGTHTHVQTADEQILPGGTAYLTDTGFTGPQESVLGREIEPIIRRFVTQMPQKFKVAKDRVMLHGAVIEVDPATGRASAIARLQEPA
ncbi:MAG: TIGR00282 family metallophosphoesterase [Verrucomicrobia bacterium]|nr:TIGR00282 family metallophosphoesterase [Verrucomicrobiota bacterium]